MSGISVRMRYGVLGVAMALAACGGGVRYRPVSDVPVRVGKPYSVRGVTYVPAADPGSDNLDHSFASAAVSATTAWTALQKELDRLLQLSRGSLQFARENFVHLLQNQRIGVA